MDIDDFDNKVFLVKLGKNIARVRASKGYTQDRLGLEAGFARGTISKIENGLSDPGATTLAKIAITIDVPVSKLFDIKIKK